MTLDAALALAAEGFHVFPCQPDGKKPLHTGWQAEATRTPQWQGGNIGISTSKFGDDAALLVIDVDVKPGKNGNHALLALELEGFDLPDTREAATPSGGRHLFFSVAAPVRQGANVLGPGLDIRSRGGYVLGVGSVIAGKSYTWRNDSPVAPAPQWLIDRCGSRARERDRRTLSSTILVDAQGAVARGRGYLRAAPLATEGAGGDDTTYKVAARLKDFGLDQAAVLDLLLTDWNERCQPPWAPDELAAKVAHAFAYGLDMPGVAAPEADFKPVAPSAPAEAASEQVHPWEALNREHAFIIAGGGSHILWETTDHRGRWALEHLNTGTFHAKFAAKKLSFGKKMQPITEGWMEWEGRRSYDGLVFMPEQQAPARFYNLWKGFAVEPWPDDEPVPADLQAGLDAWLEHTRDNICCGDVGLFKWLVGYFAHLIQRPWEKPLVAVAFKGEKGVGKNACVESVGELLGGHFLLASKRRYLTGNFNGHLENCLLFTLDEAFWSGDKEAESTLKDLITGNHHVIEHKGKEPYKVDNRTRIAIIGNEEWVVPASHDERRFAVFEVGTGRKQDRPFFQAMRERLARGGNRLLLRYLKGVDLRGVDINAAPSTDALLGQKHSSLDAFAQWWLGCLSEGRIVLSDFGEDWPRDANCNQFRAAFHRYARERHVKRQLPADTAVGKILKGFAPGIIHTKPSRAGYVYRLPPLAECRAAWDRYIGHSVKWTE